MPLLRRRPPPDPDLARSRTAFAALAERLDGAQRALLSAVPTARDPGVPLAQAIAELEDGLRRAEELMKEWWHPRAVEVWDQCREALATSRAEAEHLRLEPRALPFEQLNARIGDVLAPLEVFADAERWIRRL